MDVCTKHVKVIIYSVLLLISFIMCLGCLALEKHNHSNISDSTALVDSIILGKIIDNTIIVRNNIDLKGRRCVLPDSLILDFRGGLIKNGTLVGNNTQIISNGVIFDYITIYGSWNVENIRTDMFSDLSYTNALKNVIALTNPAIENRVLIGKGNYTLDIPKNQGRCLLINSNTTITINGTIKLLPNAHENYSMLFAEGNDIHINGEGKIIGDRRVHKGETGEWGMGVRFHGAHNSSIEGLTIQDCWGDCIYVAGNSKNILINNCILEGGRRQGISITSGEDVAIRDCNITKIGGTSPGYGIDVEPNKNDTCRGIVIERVRVANSKGGIEVFRKAENAFAGNVLIRDCTISKTERNPMRFVGCSDVSVEKCTIPKKGKGVLRENTKNLVEFGTVLK